LPRLAKIYLVILFGTTLFLQSFAVQSAELLDVQVELRKERYRLYSEVQFDASREALYELLIDYEKFEKFTSAIVESSNVEPVLLFCKSFIRNGYLLLTPMTEIVAIADPEESDFKYSRERWQLIPEGEGTLMIYDFEMEPAFWVPPVIGPFFIQRTLRRGANRAVDRIERLALEIEEEKMAAKPLD
jgi:FtsZ-binding cell division protein ZapB